MSEKIALIGFGGTIAMAPNAEGTLVPAQSAEQLVEQTPRKNLGAELDVIQLSDKDSSNLSPADWQTLIRKIADLHDDYDGFLVTHGTDTMANTSTATALALGQRLQKPIVFTGAQSTMIEPGTDAGTNLERSMRVVQEAAKQNISEVMIVFSDRVLWAARAIKTSEARYDAFDSPAFPHLADITATGLIFGPSVLRSTTETGALLPIDEFESGVMAIDISPGLEPDLVRAITQHQRCSALILKSLGVGNVPSLGRHSLLPVIKETINSGKPVIIATKFAGGTARPEIYEPGREALAAGAGHSGNMTDVATEVKLRWLMGQGTVDPEEVKREMLHPYIGEVD